MVFQASGKKTANINVNAGTDFKDLQLIKQAEEDALKKISAAKVKAERIIADAEHDVIAFEHKELEMLKKSIEKEYELEEQKAMQKAKKIKKDGEIEAEQLKQVVQARIPQAIDHIVKAVMSRT